MPGTYKLVGIFNGHKDSTLVSVRLDPRLNITTADLDARNKGFEEFYKEVDLSQRAFQALQDVRKDLKMIDAMQVNAPDSIQTKIKEKTKALGKKLSELESKFMEPEDVKGITSEVNLGRYLSNSGSYLNTTLGDPGANARDMLSQTKKEVAKNVEAVNEFLSKDWAPFKEYIDGLSWPLFKKIDTLK